MRTHARTTRTCGTSELTLPHYDFDGFRVLSRDSCWLIETPYLSQSGPTDSECPQMTSAVVVYAKLKAARQMARCFPIELRQIQAALDADRRAPGELAGDAGTGGCNDLSRLRRRPPRR